MKLVQATPGFADWDAVHRLIHQAFAYIWNRALAIQCEPPN